MAIAGTPWLRSFVIDGVERTDLTPRTRLIAHYAPVEGRTFLDLGAGDGHEARALAHAGAALAVAAEGKAEHLQYARAAQDYLGLGNHEVRDVDVRRVDEYGLPRFDVVLCFGLLYHMTNPFNVLKRIRAVTGDLLLVDTHVAPRVVHGLRDIHMDSLPWRLHEVELDGVSFEGRIVPHVGRPATSKGGLDNAWSLWLTTDSLVEAVTRAGFRVEELYTRADAGAPEPLRAASEHLRYDPWNAKVWMVATPRAGASVSVGPAVERVIGPLPEPLGRAAAARLADRLPTLGKRLLPLKLRVALRRLYMK